MKEEAAADPSSAVKGKHVKEEAAASAAVRREHVKEEAAASTAVRRDPHVKEEAAAAAKSEVEPWAKEESEWQNSPTGAVAEDKDGCWGQLQQALQVYIFVLCSAVNYICIGSAVYLV